MKVQVKDYQNKARLLIQALQSQKVELVNDRANILLIDFDGPVHPYPALIQQAYEGGAEVVLYSHGAPVITAWDGIWRPGPLTRLYLAQSPGQKTVMEAYKYPVPVRVIGWHFCEQREFQPCQDVKKVLFAPEHPHSNGYMLAEARDLIWDVVDSLTRTPFDITVRLPGEYVSGKMGMKGYHYQKSDMSIEGAVQAIDETDVVVSYPGTFASLAVARGKPLVMYGQHICPHDGYDDASLKYVKHWDDYREFMRYPYDISKVKPKIAEHIIRSAAVKESTEWRERFIGEQMKPEVLVETLRKELRL